MKKVLFVCLFILLCCATTFAQKSYPRTQAETLRDGSAFYKEDFHVVRAPLSNFKFSNAYVTDLDAQRRAVAATIQYNGVLAWLEYDELTSFIKALSSIKAELATPMDNRQIRFHFETRQIEFSCVAKSQTDRDMVCYVLGASFQVNDGEFNRLQQSLDLVKEELDKNIGLFMKSASENR